MIPRFEVADPLVSMAPGPGWPAESEAAGSGQGAGMLATYLNDHLAALTGGAELARRSRTAQQGSATEPVRAVVDRVVGLLEDDRRAVLDVMAALGVRVQHHKVVGGWAAEKVGRLKGNGSLLRRSPLSTVVELEGLQLVLGYDAALWRTLAALHSDGELRLADARPAYRAKSAATLGEALERVRLREGVRVLSADPALVATAPR